MSFIHKKLISFILVAVAASNSFAEEIKGIGDFVIGMQLEEFLNLPLIKEKETKDRAGWSTKPNSKELLKTTIDSQVPVHDRVFSDDVVRFDFMTPLGVKDAVGTDDYRLTATFYKNKLAKVYVDNAPMIFETILTTKYGKPVAEDKRKRVICQNQYGAKSSELDGRRSSIWGKNKAITATYSITLFDCDKGSFTYVVEEVAIAKVLDAMFRDGLKSWESELTKSKSAGSKL